MLFSFIGRKTVYVNIYFTILPVKHCGKVAMITIKVQYLETAIIVKVCNFKLL